MSKITIQGHVVEVAEPYTEGHVLSSNEASALNQLQHENIRNNVAAKIKRVEEEEKRTLTLDEVQKMTSAYQEEYEFGVRTGAVRDPVESEAMDIARSTIRDAIKAKGLPLKNFKSADITKLAEKHLAGPSGEKIREKAREVVAARARVAETIDLGGIELA